MYYYQMHNKATIRYLTYTRQTTNKQYSLSVRLHDKYPREVQGVYPQHNKTFVIYFELSDIAILLTIYPISCIQPFVPKTCYGLG